jgi:hypothetical protein
MSAAVGPHREMGKIGFRQLVHRYRNVSDVRTRPFLVVPALPLKRVTARQILRTRKSKR